MHFSPSVSTPVTSRRMVLSIDNQSDMSISGEIILNVSEEYTYILDAVTGLPLKEEDIKDGDTIYVYIGRL